MARSSLPRAVPSVSSRVQVRTYSQRPQTADTNEHDGGILRTLRKMETDIIKEVKENMKDKCKETRALGEETREEPRALWEETREETRALGEEFRSIREGLTILSPLKPIAASMQEGSSAASQSGESVGDIEDRLAGWIESIEPTADVITDVCMFKNGLMHDNETFTALYGMDWQVAEELIGTPLHFYRFPLASAISDTKCF